jgi:hypothetical protein
VSLPNSSHFSGWSKKTWPRLSHSFLISVHFLYIV